MSINLYLIDLASELVIKESEKAVVTTSINTIKDRLNLYFGDDVIDKKLFGSYVRGTILPRIADTNSDIDIMVVFRNPFGYKPQTFLNRLKRFAEYYYSTSEIHQSNPTVVLELNHIKFELTPAIKSNGFTYIPNGPSEWMFTDPDGFYDQLTKCNKNNSYKIKPIIRLLKYWNINKNGRELQSYLLEQKIAESMQYAYLNCYTYTDYLRQGFKTIMFYTDYEKVNEAIGHIDRALAYESNNWSAAALNEIRSIFLEV